MRGHLPADSLTERLSPTWTARYTVDGNHIAYVDDTGFTATGDVRDGVLYHEHLVLYREGDRSILKSAAEGDG
ncbi:hypothetical protein SUDANB108_00139 [Streptomyces sp. enrichment culture]|uniref:Atu4866 domain-containing protein n=1 Tax=Streptomyces sp. enrichment culture TaxID=1795815 RepID=UPI003F54A615